MTMNLVETTETEIASPAVCIVNSPASQVIETIVDEAIDCVLSAYPADGLDFDSLKVNLCAVMVAHLGHLMPLSEVKTLLHLREEDV
ncbi:hypothetical protein [Nodosilinea nodulosa]|uniref:hypothetical protein n=1 Tax=Nodosilinea nodulosa TaxID=416001 RepID=UPI0002F07230|nr:hypothetical protein [Nodosilinea nodulosa]